MTCDVVPLEPLSSDCGVAPLATGGGERSSAVAWSLEAGRSEIQRTRTEAHTSGYAHVWSCFRHFDVATRTQVVQVDWFKGTGGFTEVVDRNWTLEIERVRLDKRLHESVSNYRRCSIRASANGLHCNIQVGMKMCVLKAAKKSHSSFSHPGGSPE